MTQRTITLKELATLTNAELIGDPNYIILGVADLQSASSSDVSFLANTRYEEAMKRSSAGALFISPSQVHAKERNYLIVNDPSSAFQKAIQHFYGDKAELTGFTGIHPTAVIHPTAKLHPNVEVGPYVVIDKECTIGAQTKILAHTIIGPYCSIGSNCLIHSHVTIRERCSLGDRVILQPGVVIGSCGFGYISSHQGHTKLEQLGNVVIEDDVEIGANSTLDRGRFKSTCIKRGTKIDNLVQIGHGAVIGENNLLVAQVGIAGSSTTGSFVVLGGQVGVSGHISIGDRAKVAAKAGVSKSLEKDKDYGGVPAIPFHEYQRRNVFIKNIERYVLELKELKKKLSD